MKILSLVCVMLSFYGLSQRSEVTLKNGSVILGVIKTQNDSIIKIKTKDGSVWHYSSDNIKSIEKYDYTNSNGKLYSSVSIGFMPGKLLSKGFHIINGYRINNHWQVGVGIGIEDHTQSVYASNSYAPLFLHGQYNLLKSSTTPFLAVMAGYEMALSNQEYNKGGFTTGAKVGVNHYFSDHVGLTTSVGYRYGYFKQKNQYGWWGTFTTIREINRFEFRFGLVFK
jgi:hypothetical protein